MNGAKKFTGTTNDPVSKKGKAGSRDPAFFIPHCIWCYQGMMMSNSCEP
jgi:hypothetical protein